MVQIGFYVWTLVALSMVLLLLNTSEQRKRLNTIYVILVIAWLGYTVVLSRSGVLNNFTLPPRVPLLIVIPAIVGILILTGRPAFRDVLSRTPLHWPVYMQSFRVVVELLIYGAFLEGVFPKLATFEGLNFDILSGASAPVVAFLYQRGKLSSKGLLVWNILALLILTLTVYAFVSTYYFSDYAQAAGSMRFTELPYVLLASVLLPVAIFLHVFSIRQCLRAKG